MVSGIRFSATAKCDLPGSCIFRRCLPGKVEYWVIRQ